jgi:hypothetical protein
MKSHRVPQSSTVPPMKSERVPMAKCAVFLACMGPVSHGSQVVDGATAILGFHWVSHNLSAVFNPLLVFFWPFFVGNFRATVWAPVCRTFYVLAGSVQKTRLHAWASQFNASRENPIGSTSVQKAIILAYSGVQTTRAGRAEKSRVGSALLGAT